MGSSTWGGKEEDKARVIGGNRNNRRGGYSTVWGRNPSKGEAKGSPAEPASPTVKRNDFRGDPK